MKKSDWHKGKANIRQGSSVSGNVPGLTRTDTTEKENTGEVRRNIPGNRVRGSMNVIIRKPISEKPDAVHTRKKARIWTDGTDVRIPKNGLRTEAAYRVRGPKAGAGAETDVSASLLPDRACGLHGRQAG